METNPIDLQGEWHAGYALDHHTVSSVFLGHDEYGREEYDTKRSAVGELLFRLKYRADRTVVKVLATAAASFVQFCGWPVDAVVPVPPSRTDRRAQPVFLLAREVGALLKVPVYRDSVVKVRNTPELKTVYELEARLDILKDAHAASPYGIQGRSVLLIDDLYRSGATLNAVAHALNESGKVGKIHVLVFTKTRVNR